MRKLLLLFPVVLLGACTWGITLDPAGQSVRTAWNGNVGGCQDIGKVTVSVTDHVGPVDRNPIVVGDELEVLARNQAAQMHADTIKPIGRPVDGAQAWEVYRCGPGGPAPSTPAPPAPKPAGSGAQTFPIHGG